jgi:hypothetical protein
MAKRSNLFLTLCVAAIMAGITRNGSADDCNYLNSELTPCDNTTTVQGCVAPPCTFIRGWWPHRRDTL